MPSYIANNVPLISDVFKKQSLENILKKTYKNAVKIWSEKEGADRSALSKRFSTYDQLVTFIQEDSFESNSVANELYGIWLKELEKDELGRWFIEDIQIKKLIETSQGTKEIVLSIDKKVDDLHEEICSFQTMG